MTGWRARGLSYYRRGLRMAVRRVPAGLRSVAGLLLIVGGVLGLPAGAGVLDDPARGGDHRGGRDADAAQAGAALGREGSGW